MSKLSTTAALSGVLLLAVAPASAADVKTPLVCTIGPASGPGFELQIKNSTKAALRAETIVNIVAKWQRRSMPGEIDDCFALRAPLAPGAVVPHVMKFDRDQNPRSCTAFLSSAHPSVVHADGGTETDCD